MKDPRNFFDSPRFDNQRSNQKTLHDLKDAGGHLIAVCKRCLHRSELAPDDLIETLGSDFPLFGMRKVLRCQKCKARGWPTCMRRGRPKNDAREIGSGVLATPKYLAKKKTPETGGSSALGCLLADISSWGQRGQLSDDRTTRPELFQLRNQV